MSDLRLMCARTRRGRGALSVSTVAGHANHFRVYCTSIFPGSTEAAHRLAAGGPRRRLGWCARVSGLGHGWRMSRGAIRQATRHGARAYLDVSSGMGGERDGKPSSRALPVWFGMTERARREDSLCSYLAAITVGLEGKRPTYPTLIDGGPTLFEEMEQLELSDVF